MTAMPIPRDEFHGVGGSYTLDPKTGKRTQVEAPTAPSPNGEGGARDADGKLLDKASEALEPALAAPADEVRAPVPAAPAPRKSRLFGLGDDTTDTGKGS